MKQGDMDMVIIGLIINILFGYLWSILHKFQL